MKKLIVTCEILILFLFTARIAAVGGIIKETRASMTNSEVAAMVSPAVAATSPKVRDVFEDSLPEERKLLSSLQKREKQLDMREKLIESGEKRLALLKKEIVEKIEKLRTTEEELTTVIETYKAECNGKYKELAKVYESTPPARAGSMLEKLDNKTAAGIIMNMRSKKAGAVWGHIPPKKAVAITREITAQVDRL